MNLEPVLDALRSDPSSHLGRTARFLGHSLPTATVADLGMYREALESTLPADQTYERGYLRALIEVSAAFEREIQKDQVAERHMNGLSTARQNLLRELAKGPALVSDLASRLDRSDGAVSKLLERLRDDGLAEVTTAEGDARHRPHRLTALGRSVHRRLPEPKPRRKLRHQKASVDRSAELLETSVLAIASLIHERDEPWAHVENLVNARLSRTQAEQLLQLLRSLSLRFGLLGATDGKLVNLPTLEQDLAHRLVALSDSGQGADGLFHGYAGALPRNAQLLIRASGADVEAWKKLTHKPGRLFSSCAVLESSSELESVQRESTAEVVLLYDGTTTAYTDLQVKPSLAKLTRHNFCLAAPEQDVPFLFEPLPYPECHRVGAILATMP